MTTLIPMADIQNPEVRIYAEEAITFMSEKRWCRRVCSLELAWSIAGITGIFFVRIEPSEPDVDTELWVVVGDLPPAHLVTDEAPDWRGALEGYIEEMGRWVEAASHGRPVGDLIPVNVAPTRENAKMLKGRLKFLQEHFMDVDPTELESDA